MIAYHRVWFTVEHVGAMAPPPPDAPTPATLGAVDLDPWIPKPSTRDIVDHLVQEINAAKQIAEEITSVQGILDGLIEGDTSSNVVERVTRELEEKSRRVEELEGLLGVEREEKRILEERIRVMEDERAMQLTPPAPSTPDILTPEEQEQEPQQEREQEEKVDISTKVKDDSPATSLSIPDTPEDTNTKLEPEQTDQVQVPQPEVSPSPPQSPSTAPSSPLPDDRSISPISLPSTDSSHADPTTAALLEKITLLESQLVLAQKQIEEYKTRLEHASPVMAAVTASAAGLDFPFTFCAPSSGANNGTSRKGSVRRRVPSSPRGRRTKTEESVGDVENGTIMKRVEGGRGKDVNRTSAKDRDLIEGLVAAMGVVVLGWMGMWMINSFVERGQRAVR